MRLFDVDEPQHTRETHFRDSAKRFRIVPALVSDGAAGMGRRPHPVAHSLRGLLLAIGRLLDGMVVVGSGLWWGASGGLSTLAVIGIALLVVNILGIAGLYDGEDGYGARRSSIAAGTMSSVMVLSAAWGAHWLAGLPEIALLPWALSAGLGIGVVRPLYGWLLSRLARWTTVARRVLVVGDRDRALDVLALLSGPGRRWAFPVGLCLDRDPPPRPVMGGFIAGLSEVERMVREEGVDDVVVALPWDDSRRMAECLEILRPLAVDVHLFPEAAAPYAEGHALSLLAGVPMAKVGARPLSGGRALAKAAEDRIIGLIMLVLLAPLMAVIAVAIKLDSKGPVLFRQQRFGYDNQPFVCFKFRSMVDRPAEADVRQATRHDPRVTTIGRFLRRTSLDELPQLLNVVGGSMSLVGPRPHADSHHHYYARLVDHYRCRHRMKPGITGWAQVNGCRGETSTVESMRKRVVLDLWYIDHWSVGLDLLILARTPLACLKGTNAY